MEVRERAICVPGERAFQTDGIAHAEDMEFEHPRHG